MLRSELDPRKLWIPFGLIALVGAGAAFLVSRGNPGNMGICGACFLRDASGALGLFSEPGPKIFRPEVVGIILGALAWRMGKREWHARSGSYAATRFFFGLWMAWGSLVFLGCPFRLLQRLGGGDLNALVGALGLVAGVGIAVFFEKRGYQLGKTSPVPAPVGLLGPAVYVGLLVCFLIGGILVGPGPGEAGAPAHAPWILSLGIALFAGGVLSATGFCAITATRQIFLKRKRMLIALGCLVGAYAITSTITGSFKLGFDSQPAAHTDAVWNVLALTLVGLTGALAGGCPVRQIVMTGEGNGDAFVTTMGLLVGGASAHTLGIASSGAGTTTPGRTVVVIGLVLCVGYGVLLARGKNPTS